MSLSCQFSSFRPHCIPETFCTVSEARLNLNKNKVDMLLDIKYLDIKLIMRNGNKLESLSGGTGVHVFLVLWKAARAVEAYAENSIAQLEMCGSDFAILEALLHKGPLPV